MKKLFAVVLAAALAVGCCSTCRMRVKNAKPLEGTVWHLTKIGGESLTLPADEFNIILNENGLGGRDALPTQRAVRESFDPNSLQNHPLRHRLRYVDVDAEWYCVSSIQSTGGKQIKGEILRYASDVELLT